MNKKKLKKRVKEGEKVFIKIPNCSFFHSLNVNIYLLMNERFLDIFSFSSSSSSWRVNSLRGNRGPKVRIERACESSLKLQIEIFSFIHLGRDEKFIDSKIKERRVTTTSKSSFVVGLFYRWVNNLRAGNWGVQSVYKIAALWIVLLVLWKI